MSTVTIRNISNNTYQTVDDYTSDYYDATYRIDQLKTVDYLVSPFAGIGAAHTMLSFGFSDDRYLTISVEARKEQGELFSLMNGLTGELELMYVIADERDAILLHPIHYGDDLYLYPTIATAQQAQLLFVDMLKRANQLADQPELYNIITNTCTTNIVDHINSLFAAPIPFDLRIYLPRNSDILARELGILDVDPEANIETLRVEHNITQRVREYAGDQEFSLFIRN